MEGYRSFHNKFNTSLQNDAPVGHRSLRLVSMSVKTKRGGHRGRLFAHVVIGGNARLRLAPVLRRIGTATGVTGAAIKVAPGARPVIAVPCIGSGAKRSRCDRAGRVDCAGREIGAGGNRTARVMMMASRDMLHRILVVGGRLRPGN